MEEVESFSSNNDKTFIKLQELQTLLKKESALKELFIHTREETKKQIEEQCQNIYEAKLEVMNMIAERTKKDDRKFELVKNPGELIRDLNTYFPKLMNYLWEQPKIVSFIIQNSGNEELREHLAPFFANNFYENILSSYFIEDNLMYVLTLLLEEEINNLNDVNQYENFLDNTPCGCLLKELRKKKDIQSFFKTIIFNSVENLEVNHSSSSINFKIKEKNNELKKKQK